ncbi:MAG: SDR family oxidoreductase [Verrucomicrobia bacterium]|nr:SDR family oxidoreductase [Verrucomicrobiota bacterium]
MTYLITGATGDVGSLVVKRLIDRGERPRIFVRDSQKAVGRYQDQVEIFVGDLEDPETLKPALEGVNGLMLATAGHNLATHDEIAAKTAKSAGVARLVKLSSYDAREQNCGTGVWHAQGESAIRATGIPWVFVQPSGFMSSALLWASSIRSKGVFRTATGNGRVAFIHPDDIADVVTKALLSEVYLGQSLPITGPEALSYAEMASKIGFAIGRSIRFQSISEEEARQQQVSRGVSLPLVEAHLSIFRAIREGRLTTVTDTVERVLRRMPLTFEQWAKENAAAFV